MYLEEKKKGAGQLAAGYRQDVHICIFAYLHAKEPFRPQHPNAYAHTHNFSTDKIPLCMGIFGGILLYNLDKDLSPP